MSNCLTGNFFSIFGKFLNFKIRQNGSCSDRLEFYTLNDYYENIPTHIWCGGNYRKKLQPTGQVFLKFRTDGKNQYSGFSIRWKYIEPPGKCLHCRNCETNEEPTEVACQTNKCLAVKG